MFEKQLLKTGDGTFTFYLPDLEETYHSRHGAVAESNHVFIQNGLSLYNSTEQINILEVGWGTGLNSLLAWRWAKEHNRKISYIAVEPFPLNLEEWQALNFETRIENSGIEFSQLHELPFEKKNALDKNFEFMKTRTPIEQLILSEQSIDIIFYDAFAPKKQPEMWKNSIFSLCYKWLSVHGLLTTYCANGQFKRDLKSCRYLVKNPRGPFGKREMTVAYKIQ